MKKFQFRLQKLLQIKTHRKMERQKELAKAERVRRMEEAHLQLLYSRMTQEISDLGNLKTAAIDCRRLTQSALYQQRLINNMATQRQVITNAIKLEDEKRQVLIEAARDEKVFEKLKERQQEKYWEEVNLLDQKDTDEIAKNTFLQRARKGMTQGSR